MTSALQLPISQSITIHNPGKGRNFIEQKKKTYHYFIWISLLIGVFFAFLFAVAGDLSVNGDTTMLFLYIPVAPVCTGVILSRLYRTRDKLLARIGALEASIEELKEAQKQ